MLESAMRLIYPPHCMTCNAQVDGDGALCSSCWGETKFITGLVCSKCGSPLPGEAQESDELVLCDECMTTARPWDSGRAALMYQDNGRKIVLALKHGDRTEFAKPAGKWLAATATPLTTPQTLIAPVPLHWTRLLKRRYNQSALLAQQMAVHLQNPVCQDLLVRRRKTASLDGKTRDERFAILDGNIMAHPKRRRRLAGRPILLVDDVMTSGATLAASAEACLAAGAASVSVVTLARVGRDV